MFNQKLKFSWGHIFAFIALLFIAYMTFLSVTYYTLGDYILAGAVTFIVVAILFVIFIYLQRLKACDSKFNKNIKRERVVLGLSFILFIVLMLPFLRGWSVIKDNDKIIQNFKSSINESKNIFTQYEQYSKKRIDNYKQRLDSIATSVKPNKFEQRSNINNIIPEAYNKRSKNVPNDSIRRPSLKSSNDYNKRSKNVPIDSIQDSKQQTPDLYKEIGFDGKKDSYLINNRLTLLKIQIDSTNYEKIRDNALQWIEQANQGGSVWNVFLFGNLKIIKSSISSWHSSLQEFSSKKFVAEEESIMEFDKENKILNSAINSIDQLENIYKQSNELYIWGLITMVFAYLFLLMPWIVQERNTKSREKILSINNIKKKSETNSTDWFGDSNTNNTDNNKDKEGYKHKPF